MPIAATDIKRRLSITSSAAGNSSPSSGPASLGKYISTTDLSSVTGLNLLFDRISGAENAAMTADYRCVFYANTHGTLTWLSPKVWLQGGDPSGGAAVAIAVDPTPASPIDSAAAQALTAASETAPGSGVTSLTFSSPSTEAAGIALDNIPPGYCRAVWIRRTAQNNAAVTETVTLAYNGGTLA